MRRFVHGFVVGTAITAAIAAYLWPRPATTPTVPDTPTSSHSDRAEFPLESEPPANLSTEHPPADKPPAP